MSSQTPNINLTLPTGAENVSRQIINDNNTKIDTAVGTLSNKIAKSSDTVVSNIDGVKSALLTFASSLGRGESKLVTICHTDNNDADIMRPSARYSGYLCKTYLSSFTWLASSAYSDIVTFSYDGSSTWSISKLNGKSASVEKLTDSTNTTITGGGYIRVGRIVTISFTVTISQNLNENAVVATGCPAALHQFPIVGFKHASGSRGTPVLIRIDDSVSRCYANAAIASGTYIFSGSYLAK